MKGRRKARCRGLTSGAARAFVRTGFVLTIIALALVMILGATYWRWLGYA